MVKKLDHNINQYESCMFEIKSQTRRILTRDFEDFLQKSKSLSRLQDVTLYKIEKTLFGTRKTRMFFDNFLV